MGESGLENQCFEGEKEKKKKKKGEGRGGGSVKKKVSVFYKKEKRKKRGHFFLQYVSEKGVFFRLGNADRYLFYLSAPEYRYRAHVPIVRPLTPYNRSTG